MNFKKKYLKYKFKYLTLKSNLEFAVKNSKDFTSDKFNQTGGNKLNSFLNDDTNNRLCLTYLISIPKSNRTWLEELFVSKLIKYLQESNLELSDITSNEKLIKNNFNKHYKWTGTEKKCKELITHYSNSLSIVVPSLKPKINKNLHNLNCEAFNHYTWAVIPNTPNVSYPVEKHSYNKWESQVYNCKKCSKNQKVLLEQNNRSNLHLKYDFHFRNLLIPSHEIFHIWSNNPKYLHTLFPNMINQINKIKDMKKEKENNIFKSTNLEEIKYYLNNTLVSEWNASVGNLSLYLYTMKQKILSEPENKLKLQLETLESVIWVYHIVNKIVESYHKNKINQHILNVLSNHSKNMNTELLESKNIKNILDVIGIITRFELNQGKARLNTFYKHFMALEHSNYLFETINNDTLLITVSELNQSKDNFIQILEQNYIPYKLWTKSTLNELELAEWIK